MYFPITVFNVVTLFLLLATIVMAYKRFTLPGESNWPLVYYAILIAYWRSFTYSLDNYWVLMGVLCGLLLRFEFLSGPFQKVIRAIELVVFGYIVWRCFVLIMMW